MGRIFKAVHRRLKRTFAVKIISDHRLLNRTSLERFEKEMEALGRLNHPNIILATDAGDADGVAYIAMEYIAGINLQQLLNSKGPLAIADGCAIVRQAATGLDYIDQNSFVHRDIKPSNLMLTRDGQVKILDLGLARFLLQSPDHDPLTQTGDVMGTGDYMSPEQGIESHCVDIRSDIYSLGCVFHALLTGKPPFAQPQRTALFHKIQAHQSAPLPDLLVMRPDVPAEVNAILRKMLSKLPSERPQKPAEVVSALEPYCAGAGLDRIMATIPNDVLFAGSDRTTQTRDPERTVPRDEPRPARQPARRIRPIAAAVAIVCLAGISIGILANFRSQVPASGICNSIDQVRVSHLAVRQTITEPGWHDLLQRSPLDRYWPADKKDSRWFYHENEREITITSAGRCLLQLARTSAPRYTLEVAFRQHPWSGGIGVYYGDDLDAEGPGDLKYHHVSLIPFQASMDTRTCRFEHERVSRSGPKSAFSTFTIGSEDLPRPVPNDHTLLIEVGPQGLERAQWDDTPLTLLRNDDRPSPSPQGIGIIIAGSSVIVKRARLYIPE